MRGLLCNVTYIICPFNLKQSFYNTPPYVRWHFIIALGRQIFKYVPGALVFRTKPNIGVRRSSQNDRLRQENRNRFADAYSLGKVYPKISSVQRRVTIVGFSRGTVCAGATATVLVINDAIRIYFCKRDLTQYKATFFNYFSFACRLSYR